MHASCVHHTIQADSQLVGDMGDLRIGMPSSFDLFIVSRALCIFSYDDAGNICHDSNGEDIQCLSVW
jgi:hypothetical protein